LKEQIDKIIREGNWEFSKLLKLKEISQELADEMYSELSTGEILELIWHLKVDADNTFGQIIRTECIRVLQEEFINSFQKYFESATVSFKSPEPEKHRVESISEEQPPLPKPKAKKSDKEKEMIKGEDGFDMPKGVKRV
tara:strand:- start:622 stop:1038 length:417 start_codon:yes stop_codon:yes gene_type:complete